MIFIFLKCKTWEIISVKPLWYLIRFGFCMVSKHGLGTYWYWNLLTDTYWPSVSIPTKLAKLEYFILIFKPFNKPCMNRDYSSHSPLHSWQRLDLVRPALTEPVLSQGAEPPDYVILWETLFKSSKYQNLERHFLVPFGGYIYMASNMWHPRSLRLNIIFCDQIVYSADIVTMCQVLP